MNLARTLNYSVRRLVKSSGFTAIVVLCLGISIGANTTIFSFMNELFLQPLPVKDPDRLVRIYTKQTNGSPWGSFSYPDYQDYRALDSVFSGLAVERPTPLSLSTGKANERIWGAVVSENYFSVLGVKLPLGTSFEEREFSPLVVLSHRFWQSRFDGDPGAIGKTVVLNGGPFTVVGVAPREFHGTSVGFSPQVWVPITMQAQLIPGTDLLKARGSRSLLAIGRLRPGMTLEQSRTPLGTLSRELATRYPSTNSGAGTTVIPAGAGNLYPPVRQGALPLVLVFQVMVGLVLLLACANIATLMLSRALGRRREIALQLALGASRRELLRQLLAESMILAFLGGVAGLLIAVWTAGLLRSFNPVTDVPISLQLDLDGRVLVFNFAVALVAGLVFGLTPVSQSLKQNLVAVLVDGSSGGGSRSRLRKVLVIAQVALSLVLLIVAGLFVRGLQKAEDIHPGFQTENIVVASLDLGVQGYDSTEGELFYRRLLERLRSSPEVQAVSLAETSPLNPFNRQTGISPEGYDPPGEGGSPVVEYNVITPDYFRTLEIPVVSGRVFTEQDDAKAPPVVVVNEALARRYWPDQEPVGRRLRTKGKEWRVAGVVKTGKYTNLAESPKPYLYLPFHQFYEPAMVVHLRTTSAPSTVLQTLRSQIGEMDPALPIFGGKPLVEQLAVALLPARIGALLMSAFGLLALLLAAVGLYGMLAYSVSQRAREIGIRAALGADSRKLLWLVVGQGVKLAVAGILVGLALAFAATGFISGLLYGVSPVDPVTFLGVSLFLIGVAVLASYIPARRAVRVDPIITLRAT